MANIKSQIKRNKQNEKAHLRNKAVKSSLRTSVRKFREAADGGNLEAAETALRAACRQLDKAASKGVVHKPGREPQVRDGQAIRRDVRQQLEAPARSRHICAPRSTRLFVVAPARAGDDPAHSPFQRIGRAGRLRP